MSETLPMGWINATLNDVANWGSGGTPKATEKKYYNGNIPWLIIADLNNGVVTKSKRQISEIGLENSSAKWVEIGAVLIAMYGSIGKLGIAGIRCTTNQAIAFTNRIWDNMPNLFLFYYLQYQGPDLLRIGQGGAQKNISQSILKKYPILLPPLNEQKRIAAKLDKIIPRIDSIKERLDKIPTIIKRFRQSVLTAAVTGKLTEKWREEHPDVEHAEVLLEKIGRKQIEWYRQKKTSKPKIPTPINNNELKSKISSNWKWCRIAEILLKMSTGPFGSMLHKSDYIPDGIPVINPTNIIDGKLVPSEKMMISQDTLNRLSKYTLFENDIVIARRGDLSKCGVVTKEEEGWLCGTGLFFLKLGINSTYFRLFYISDFCQTALSSDAIGSTMANLNQKVLSNILVPLPPLEEQKEIVRQADKLFSMADKLEEHYRNARAKVDKLSQSVLAKTFRGELVITESELAEKEGRDFESAEKLLERIKAEKTKLETELKKQKKKGGRRKKSDEKNKRSTPQ